MWEVSVHDALMYDIEDAALTEAAGRVVTTGTVVNPAAWTHLLVRHRADGDVRSSLDVPSGLPLRVATRFRQGAPVNEIAVVPGKDRWGDSSRVALDAEPWRPLPRGCGEATDSVTRESTGV